MKKIVVASDSFKGSLSSREVAEAVANGIKDINPHCQIIKLCVADGGEGTVTALVESLLGRYVHTYVSDPLGRKIKATYGLIDNDTTAVIEIAEASGLSLLLKDERNPMKTSTFGTGELIADAIKRGSKKLYIGIGGSATNDAGVGMLQALGYRFFDIDGNVLEGGGEILNRIHSVDNLLCYKQLPDVEMVVACDVENPLYGENGASYVYARQKGADSQMIKILDNGLKNFANVIERYIGKDLSNIPGVGAAGGLGFAFISLLNAKLVRGIDMVLDAMNFNEIIKVSDLIITGEGKIDNQTSMGKTPWGVLKRAEQYNVPVIAICGCLSDNTDFNVLQFKDIIQVTPNDMLLDEAMLPDVAKNNVREAVSKIAIKYLI